MNTRVPVSEDGSMTIRSTVELVCCTMSGILRNAKGVAPSSFDPEPLVGSIAASFKSQVIAR